MANSVNARNLVTFSLLHFEEAIENFTRYGQKVFYDYMGKFEHHARKWSYELLEGEEREAAIQLFSELEARASKLFFADTYVVRKGKRTMVLDKYGPIVSVLDGHYGDDKVIKLAAEYGRRWPEYL